MIPDFDLFAKSILGCPGRKIFFGISKYEKGLYKQVFNFLKQTQTLRPLMSVLI